MNISPELLIETLKGIEGNSIIPQKQMDANSTYAPMMDKELGHINWDDDSDNIYNLIRGVTPFPGAYCMSNGKVLKIWRAEKLSNIKYENPGQIVDISKLGIEVACGDGSILIKEIQESGSKRMSVDSFLNGHTIDKGIKLE
jgi:methionyl-tRNA formyltransferase